MIQRIQSIYLVLVGILTIIVFFIPIINIEFQNNKFVFETIGIYKISNDNLILLINTIPLLIVCGLICVISFTTIFLYKNRKLQMKMCYSNFALNFIFIALIFYVYPELIIKNTIGDGLTLNYSFGVFIPIISLILLFFAVNAIKKDEEIVKSIDRLR